MKKGSRHTKKTKDKIAKSMEGSSNAEKWTEPVVIDTLEKMITSLTQEYEVIIGRKEGFKDSSDKKEDTESKSFTIRKKHLKKTVLVDLNLGGVNIDTCLGITNLKTTLSDLLNDENDDIIALMEFNMNPNVGLIRAAADNR